MNLYGGCAIGVIALAVTASGCSTKDANYEVLVAKRIRCPDSATLAYRPWGKAGLMAVCQLEHGPVLMAEDGRIVIVGTNALGKPQGEWRWLDEDGNVARTESR
jgi:hypothetical protein